MHVVFHSIPPHPIIQPEQTIEPKIPSLISEMDGIEYTQASNQEELLNSFQSLAKNIKESTGPIQYSVLLYSIRYIDQKMFPLFINSQLSENVFSALEVGNNKKKKNEIDDHFYLLIQRCILPFSQMIINGNQSIFLFEKAIIKIKLKKSTILLRSIHISIRLTQWISNSERDVYTLQIILCSLRKIKVSIIPIPLATEIAHSLIITAFLFQSLSSSNLYRVRRDLVICISKLLIYQPNSFANESTIECLNYLNDHDLNDKNMNITNLLFSDSNKEIRLLTAIPAIDALRIPEKVPIKSILQQIRFTLFSANIYDINNLLNIATISSSSQSAIIRNHPEFVNLEDFSKIFFGRCLSIDTASKFIKFDKTPKNLIELASFLRSNNISKTAHLNALTKDLGKIVNVVYMSIKRLPRISTDIHTLISAAKIMSFFISYVSQRKLKKYGFIKHNLSLTPQSKLFINSASLLNEMDDIKSMTKKVKKMLFKENLTSILPQTYTFVSEIVADSLISSPLFPHFTNTCCPESLLLLAAFEELAKSLALHPQDFLSVILNTNSTPGRVKLLTIAIKNAIKCYNEKENKSTQIKDKKTTTNKKKNLSKSKSAFDDDDDDENAKSSSTSENEDEEEDKEEDDCIDDIDDDFENINESLFIDEETVEVWKRMIKANLNKICQFGLSILKIPCEITCQIAADFFLSLVAFVSIFLSKGNQQQNEAKKSSTSSETDSQFSFAYDDLYAILFAPMNMLIIVSNSLFQIEPINNPKKVIFFLGFIEKILSSTEAPDLDLNATVVMPKEEEDEEQKSPEKKVTYIKMKTNVNATAIVKSFFVLNGPMAFWDCLYNMINSKMSSASGLLAARALRIIALISDFNNTLQIRLSMAQRLVIDVLHNSIITNIIDMLNRMNIQNFESISSHEKCTLSLAMAQLLLSWCEPLPLTAFVATRVSYGLVNLIEKLSFSISNSNSNFLKKGNSSNSQALTIKQKQSLAFENSVLDILKVVREKFDFAISQEIKDDLVIAQQSIPSENVPQKLSGLFFMALESIMQSYDDF